MICQYCGGEIKEKTNSCIYCGAPCEYYEYEDICEEDDEKICETAGKEYVPFYKKNTISPLIFSEEEDLAVKDEDRDKDKSRFVYILLAIFLGCFGLHNFYANYKKRGITQLLLTVFLGWTGFILGILAVWIFIEIIITNKDGNGKPFSI